jgi:hypothetical protein
MARTLLIIFVLLAGCSRLAPHKLEGTGVMGTFASFNDGTLGLKVKQRDSAASALRNFRLRDDIPVTIFHGDDELQTTPREAFADVHEGTPTIVRIDGDERVLGVQVGVRARKRDK